MGWSENVIDGLKKFGGKHSVWWLEYKVLRTIKIKTMFIFKRSAF